MNSSGADFNQTGGTFTATSGTMLTSDNFISSGGTYTHNNGTIGWTDSGDDSYSFTANGRTFWGFTTANTCAGTITFGSSNVITFAGPITFGASCSNAWVRFDGSTATLNVTGSTINVTGIGVGGQGGAVFLINGTGNQTIVGETDSDSRITRMTVNKASGTFTIQNTIVLDDNFTFTAAGSSFVSTGSKVIMNARDDAATVAFTGTWDFNDWEFNEGCNTHTLNGGVLRVNGTLTFNNPACEQNEYVNSNSGAAIHARGNIVGSGFGSRGSVVVTINGTGNQTITGENDTNTFIPAITLNKASGTLNFVNTIGSLYSTWTYTAGTIDTTGTGTVLPYQGTLTGNWNFPNMILSADNFSGTTISSGTTVTMHGTLTLAGVNGDNSRLIGAGSLHARGM